jgi:deoxyadenosine/deoxycytidine kinase
MLAIAGPSGVGKSTLARALAAHGNVFLETTTGNPYLPDLLAGRLDRFDAVKNQEWFLHRMSVHIQQADPGRVLVLDQDPAAIVFTYGRMWLESGKIPESAFAHLVERLIDVEQAASRWRVPRTTIILDAPAAVLHQRVETRDRKQAPPLEWFGTIQRYFAELRSHFQNAVVVSTAETSPDEVLRSALVLLERSRPL